MIFKQLHKADVVSEGQKSIIMNESEELYSGVHIGKQTLTFFAAMLNKTFSFRFLPSKK